MNGGYLIAAKFAVEIHLKRENADRCVILQEHRVL